MNEHQPLDHGQLNSVEERYLLAARRTLSLKGGQLATPDEMIAAEDHLADLRLLMDGITSPYVEALKLKAGELKPTKSWTSLRDFRQNHVTTWQDDRPDTVYAMSLHHSSRPFPRQFEMHRFEMDIDARTGFPSIKVGLGLDKKGVKGIYCEWWRPGSRAFAELAGATLKAFSRDVFTNDNPSHNKVAGMYMDLSTPNPIIYSSVDPHMGIYPIESAQSRFHHAIYEYSPTENVFLARRRPHMSSAPHALTTQFSLDLATEILALLPTDEIT